MGWLGENRMDKGKDKEDGEVKGGIGKAVSGRWVQDAKGKQVICSHNKPTAILLKKV